MGKRGPPPLPAAVKKARGTFEKTKDRAAGLLAGPPGTPPVPTGLPPTAARRWAETAPELLRLGTLAETDGGALEGYCRAYAVWCELMAEAEAKPIVKTPFGPKENPALVAARKLDREIVQPREAALGLHYAARCRMRAPEKPKEDAVEKELFGNLTAIEGGKT